ncbi:hypothetical protein CAI22_08845 [Acinetobacter johnsonii]|nr:hypothetical protein [Acinetobacter johnsonii]
MICNHAKAVVDIVNVMKKILIPIFVAAVCLLGFVVFQDTETKKQQQLNQLMNSAEPRVQKLSPFSKAKVVPEKVNSSIQSDAETIIEQVSIKVL